MQVDARRTISGVLVALAIAAGAGACGSSASPEGLDPPQAADALARNLGLDAEQTSCMRGRFDQAPGAAAVLAPDTEADEDARATFLAAIRACLPPEQFGTTLAATVRSELPDATEAQATCVRDNVVALPAPEQDRLYLYFANPAALDVADVGQAGVDLLASCDLMPATDDEVVDTPVDAPVDTTVAP
jgi:hypothetical protein